MSEDELRREAAAALEAAAAWAEQKKREGWTREDFARELGVVLGVDEGEDRYYLGNDA